MKLNLNNIIAGFNSLSEQSRYAILVGVVFFIILVDALFLIMPQWGSINDINDQIKKMSDGTQAVLDDRGQANLLKKKLQEARSQFGTLSSKVRAIQEVPAILSTISSIANDNGVKIDQLTPNKSQQETLTSAPDGKYYALPVVVKTRCGYHNFGRFLNKLENQDLYFVMKEFIIQNDDKDPNTHLFSMTINLILVDRGPQSR